MIAIFYLVLQILKIYTYVVIANVVISWLVAFNVLNTSNRFVYSILEFTYRLTEPFLNRIRRFLPNLGAFDISPIILLLLIWFIEMCMKLYVAPMIFQQIMILIDGKKIAIIFSLHKQTDLGKQKMLYFFPLFVLQKQQVLLLRPATHPNHLFQ